MIRLSSSEKRSVETKYWKREWVKEKGLKKSKFTGIIQPLDSAYLKPIPSGKLRCEPVNSFSP